MSGSSASNSNELPAPLGGSGGGGIERKTWLPVLIGGLFATLAITGSALLGKFYRRRASAGADEGTEDDRETTAAPVVALPTPPPPARTRAGKHQRREIMSLAKLRA